MAGPYFGTQATLENDATFGNRVKRGAQTLGALTVFEEDYTLLGTEAATEIINIHKNRGGLLLVPHLSAVISTANPGTALVFDIGDDDDPDKYADGLICSSAGTFLLSTEATKGVHNTTPVYTTDTGEQGDFVKATFATATSLNAVKIRFLLVYQANS